MYLGCYLIDITVEFPKIDRTLFFSLLLHYRVGPYSIPKPMVSNRDKMSMSKF